MGGEPEFSGSPNHHSPADQQQQDVLRPPPVPPPSNLRPVPGSGRLQPSGETSFGDKKIVEKYATLGLDKFTVEDHSSYKLVEVGPLGEGNFEERRIFHLNFKAKNLKSDDPVEAFFCEIVETGTRKECVCDSVFCLGPSVSLPDKADTLGCVYCGSLPIHHPACSFCYRTGRDEHFDFLRSEVRKIQEHIKKCLSEHRTPSYPNVGVENLGKTIKQSAVGIEEVALRVYNEKKNTKFILVKTGYYAQAYIGIGIVRHLTFFAKDDPDAPLQTFFCEVIIRASFFFVDFCECLGPSDDLPHIADVRGCCYCDGSRDIHHPPGSGYLNGHNMLNLG